MDLDVKAKATMLGAVMLIVSTYSGFPLPKSVGGGGTYRDDPISGGGDPPTVGNPVL